MYVRVQQLPLIMRESAQPPSVTWLSRALGGDLRGFELDFGSDFGDVVGVGAVHPCASPYGVMGCGAGFYTLP